MKQLFTDVWPFNEPNENLKAGCKKRVIYPLNLQPVFQRLPGGIVGPQTSEELSL